MARRGWTIDQPTASANQKECSKLNVASLIEVLFSRKDISRNRTQLNFGQDEAGGGQNEVADMAEKSLDIRPHRKRMLEDHFLKA
jgi:hypothetical protein